MTRIMIADDDPSIIDALKMLLTDEGYDVATTLDGRTLPQVVAPLPDLILLDVWMSGINGRDICLDLRHNETTKNIPVIMMSANRDTKTIADQAGADDYIYKPFDITDMLTKIESCLTNP